MKVESSGHLFRSIRLTLHSPKKVNKNQTNNIFSIALKRCSEMALSSVWFDSSHRLLCSQHATCELNVTLTRREFTGWRGKRIHSHLLCQKNKAITTVIYHTVKLSSVSDPDTICTKPRCSYFHFKAVFACEYTTSEWRLYRGEGIWKQILYIYIYCISVHIFIFYTNIDSSQLQSMY